MGSAAQFNREVCARPANASPPPSASPPNQQAPGNAGIASRFVFGHHWPGVPEPERSAAFHATMKPFKRVRAMQFLMRLAAVSVFFSGISFFLPSPLINSFLVWCGLPQMPDAPLMRYILHGAGYLQVAYGIVVWVVARDVVRHQPVVIAFIVIFLMGAPAFYWIDAAAGLPWYWCSLDAGCCFLGGSIPLAFWFWPSKSALEPTGTAPVSSTKP